MTRAIPVVEQLSAERGLITVLSWAGLIVVLSQGVTRYEQIDIVMRRAVIFGSVVAAIGIFEFYSGINVTDYVRIPGLSLNIDFSTLLTRGRLPPIEYGGGSDRIQRLNGDTPAICPASGA